VDPRYPPLRADRLRCSASALLGARWSYTELGCGYWAWDPVENAALMPWLPAPPSCTRSWSRRSGMLKVWNAPLVALLRPLGTFLVRSGCLQSIHAFGDNTVGPYILGLIGWCDRLDGADRLPLDDLRSPKRSTRWSPASRPSSSTTCCSWRSARRSSGAPSSR
jgi:hypothetical protein